MLSRPAWCVAMLALLCVTACSRPAPDVIVILVDTLRADRVGSRPGLTPFLDSLAATGVVFSNAYSATSWTNPAVASLFTSRYPSQHHVSTFESVLAADEVTLAERLHAAGYRNLGVVANFRLLDRFGFNRGFDLWSTPMGPRSAAGKASAKRVAHDTFSLYDQWFAPSRFSRWARRRRPTLLYLHFMEPHAPYDPPAHVRARVAGPPPAGVDDAVANAKILDTKRWRELSPEEVARLEALYDAEVADLDSRLSRLFDGLRSRGLLDHAIVVFTADHGEEFREHGGLQHGNTLYQESVRIPLFVVGPGVPAGRVVTDRVSLLDIAPTVLDLAGLPPEPRFEGQSLTAHFAGARSNDIVLQLLPAGQQVDVRRHAAALIHDDAKLLVPPEDSGRSPELYDLANDPHETRSDPPSIAAQAPALASLLAARDATLATGAGTTERGTLSDAERARLRALGYAD
jgi:arylsulfatase A-like enzyme